MTPPRCKCKVSYSPRSQAENIQWCPLHKAAEDMYEALKDARVAVRCANNGHKADFATTEATIQTAIAKAEGRNR